LMVIASSAIVLESKHVTNIATVDNMYNAWVIQLLRYLHVNGYLL